MVEQPGIKGYSAAGEFLGNHQAPPAKLGLQAAVTEVPNARNPLRVAPMLRTDDPVKMVPQVGR